MRLHRIGECPAKGLFGSFLVLQKGTRTRSGRKPCTCFVRLSCVATRNREEQSFRAVRAAYFCLVKSKHDSAKRWRTAKPARRASAGGASQTAIAGRDPPHEAAAGPCASRSTGHIVTFTVTQPKLASLRHGLLYGPAALRCSARFTARTSNAKAKRQQKKQRQRQKSRSKKH